MSGLKNRKAVRVSSLLATVAFLFFLIELMPHRVHHMFDEDAENTCVAFNVSKSCVLSVSSGSLLILTDAANELLTGIVQSWFSYLSPSPFLKRAPPVHQASIRT
jgi:hypothetical protein